MVIVLRQQPVLLAGLLLVLSTSCQEKPVEYFNRKYIQTFYPPDCCRSYIAGDSTKITPAPDYSRIVFVVVDSNRLAYVQKGALTEVYIQHFPSVNFYDFMDDALNQKTVFPSTMIPKYIGHTFRLTNSIVDVYQQHGTESLFEAFFEKTESGYRLKPLPEGKRFTILYFMFLNGYEVNFDDYQGRYSVTAHNP